MKKLTTLLLVLTFTVVAIAQKNLELKNTTPTPGSVITIEYMPRNTVLQGVKDFDAVAYLLEGGLPVAKDIKLKQEGGVFRGTVKTNDTTRAVFFSFSKDDLQDNNNNEGYYTFMYDKKGTILPGSQASVASAFSGNGMFWNLKRNPEKSAELNKIEFAQASSREKFNAEYLGYLNQSKDEADKALLKAEVEKLANQKDLSEADMMRLRNYYNNFLKDKEKAKSIEEQVKLRFPNGSWRKSEMIIAFNTTKSLTDKLATYNKLAETFPPTNKNEKQLLESTLGRLIRMQVDSGDYATARVNLDKMSPSFNKANVLNGIAWKLSGEGMTKVPKDVDLGLQVSRESLNLVEAEQKSLADKPVYLSEKQYRRQLESTKHMFGDTYATLLYHKGDIAKAYEYEKAAVEFYKYKVGERNEALAFLTEKLMGVEATQALLEKCLEDGKYTPVMKEQLQRIYTSSGRTEAQWAAYSNSLEERAYNRLKAELAKKMINLPAPQFALKDLDGNKVSMASLKGKIVVVDFWATWCGPCIASFPSMQTAVNKFKNNPDVVFLFIDTWENDSNRVQKVTDFIAKNKYSFHVLYDDPKAKEGNDFVVVQEFGVEGIPTKFVIDRNNNIRFKTVGYNSNADEAVAELTTMIDIAAAESGEPFKKAF